MSIERRDEERAGVKVWDAHILEAAKQFLKCAVVIDDRPFGASWADDGRDDETSEGGPIRGTRRLARRGGKQETLTEGNGESGQELGRVGGDRENRGEEPGTPSDQASASNPHDLDLGALTDAFAECGIVCGTLVPGHGSVALELGSTGYRALLQRAETLGRAADILIVDWFLQPRRSDPTVQIIRGIVDTDEREGGRTRLICVYTGEKGLDAIREEVKSSLEGSCCLKREGEDGQIRLTAGNLLVVFCNKKSVGGDYAVDETNLPVLLIKEFGRLIDGLLPSFAASAIGAIRRSTHGVLRRFQSVLDPAYVGNRAICDPPEDMAQLVRELLVSELDSLVGFAKSADRYLSSEAISGWLERRGRVRDDCVVTMAVQGDGGGETVERVIDRDLIIRACNGSIETFDRPFEIDEGRYKINEKQREKFTCAVCGSEEEARCAEETFARIVSNKREACDLDGVEGDWRPSLTLGTVLSAGCEESVDFYLCVTRACDMLRLSSGKKKVILLRLEQSERRFNLVVGDLSGESKRLLVPREFSDMEAVEFRVDDRTRRITGAKNGGDGRTTYCFKTASGDREYRYIAELRYLRALRDVDEMVRRSTGIGVADSEWLRLRDRR